MKLQGLAFVLVSTIFVASKAETKPVKLTFASYEHTGFHEETDSSMDRDQLEHAMKWDGCFDRIVRGLSRQMESQRAKAAIEEFSKKYPAIKWEILVGNAKCNREIECSFLDKAYFYNNGKVKFYDKQTGEVIGEKNLRFGNVASNVNLQNFRHSRGTYAICEPREIFPEALALTPKVVAEISGKEGYKNRRQRVVDRLMESEFSNSAE